MPTKAPITLKREITELLASGNFGMRSYWMMMRLFSC